MKTLAQVQRDLTKIITLYEPDPAVWSEFRTRR